MLFLCLLVTVGFPSGFGLINEDGLLDMTNDCAKVSSFFIVNFSDDLLLYDY